MFKLSYLYVLLVTIFNLSLSQQINNFKYNKAAICNSNSPQPIINPNPQPVINPSSPPVINPSPQPESIIYNKPKCRPKKEEPQIINTIGTANVWDQCGGNNIPNKKCINSKCIKYSPYYSQCLPDKLSLNALCGQNDNKEINWFYDNCESNLKCKSIGNGNMDFRCM